MRCPARRASSRRCQTGSTWRQDARRQGQQVVQQSLFLERLGAQPAQQRVVVQQQLVELVRQGLRLGQVADADRTPGHLVLVGRADAAAGGADLALAAGRLARTVQRRMQRQDERRIVGDPQIGRGHVQPLFAHPLHLRQQRHRIDHDAIADHAQFAADQAGGQQAQPIGLVADDQRVPGIMAALEPHHDIGAAGQPVHDLPLALVTPLGADHRHVRHVTFVLRSCGLHPQSSTAVPSRRICVQRSRAASPAGSSTGSSAATVAYPWARNRAASSWS